MFYNAVRLHIAKAPGFAGGRLSGNSPFQAKLQNTEQKKTEIE